MNTTFDISVQNLPRTFKEKLNDFHESTWTGGLFNLLAFIILILPLTLLAIGESIYNNLVGKKVKPQTFDLKEYVLETPDLKIKTFGIYEKDEYYDYLKTEYNKSDDDLRELDDICFVETFPSIPTLDKKLFTYDITNFFGGIIFQEVNFDKIPWTSKLVYFDPKNRQTEIIEVLDYVYRLTYIKLADNELKCELRKPGEKKMMTIIKYDVPTTAKTS
jgi:hypothetical protein